jgi:hypothetical protein
MNSIDIYTIFFSSTAQSIFFSKTDILEHKANFSKYKKVEITPYIPSDCNGIKLEHNSKSSYRKQTHGD